MLTFFLIGFSDDAQKAFAANALNGRDAEIYRAAFAALESKQSSLAVSQAAAAQDRTLYNVVVGLAMAADDDPYDFAGMRQFLAQCSYWAESDRKAIAKRAEGRITGAQDPRALISFFQEFPPQTGDGFKRYVAALQAAGQKNRIATLVRERWRENDFGPDEQAIFLSDYGSMLSSADLSYRVDRLIWDKKYEHAQRLEALLPSDLETLIEARIALLKGHKNAPGLLSRVPRPLQGDSGLLYARMTWRIKNDDKDGARDILRAAGMALNRPEEWWDERHMLARDLLDQGDARGAYALASRHGITTKSTTLTDAEFFSGFIALRYLHDAAMAAGHFKKLYDSANTLITAARGAYWMGRALEAMGQNALSWYQAAAQFSSTYYGQLALARLYQDSQISAVNTGIPSDVVGRFADHPSSAIVQQLLEIGQRKMAERFALAFASQQSHEFGFRLMAALATENGAPDIAVKIAKQAAKKMIALPVEGYPLLNDAAREKDAALVHAIIRQESQFDPVVTSPSNAQGLMQLLPSTAKYIARKSGGDEEANLYNGTDNIRLGSAYIQYLLEKFDGNATLAIAGYNAGPSRSQQWLASLGDPRQMDPVDWVERIPFNETRNYVMRVMEALQLYRARLSGGSASLTIMQDLTGRLGD